MGQTLRRTFAVAVAFCTGVVQGYVLKRLLVDCLPYKEISDMPQTFYESYGNLLAFACPVCALGLAAFLVRRHTALAPLAVAVSIPVLVLAVLTVATAIVKPGFLADSSEFSALGALFDFATYLPLMVLFSAAPGAGAWPILHLTRPEED